MKKLFRRLGKSLHQIFTYFNLIDAHHCLSLSTLSLYASFITTLFFMWLGFDIFRISISVGLTFMCFVNYAYRRWLYNDFDKKRDNEEKLSAVLKGTQIELELANRKLNKIESQMKIGGVSPEGNPFRGRMPL